MSDPELTPEQIAALEAELDKITVDDVLLQTVVSLLNLGARRAGMGQTDARPDLDQLKQAIDGARALMPLLEARHGDKLAPIRDTISQLQMVYARAAGQTDAPEPDSGTSEGEQGPGPAQQSGRLWVPGQ